MARLARNVTDTYEHETPSGPYSVLAQGCASLCQLRECGVVLSLLTAYIGGGLVLDLRGLLPDTASEHSTVALRGAFYCS